MMKYEKKEIWNWKQVEIILWKEQKDWGKKRDKWRKKENSGRVRQWYHI